MITNQRDYQLYSKLIDRIDIKTFIEYHNLRNNKYLRNHSYTPKEFSQTCKNIKDIDIYGIRKAIKIAFDNYISQNKYSSLKGFKENDRNYRKLLGEVKYLKEKNFTQIHDYNGIYIYIVKIDGIPIDGIENTFYSSKLSKTELKEYLHIIYNELINFDPDKNTNQENIMKRFNDLPNDYYVVVELLATNEIIKKDGFFYFDKHTYSSGSSLNDAVNNHFKFEKRNLMPNILQTLKRVAKEIFYDFQQKNY